MTSSVSRTEPSLRLRFRSPPPLIIEISAPESGDFYLAAWVGPELPELEANLFARYSEDVGDEAPSEPKTAESVSPVGNGESVSTLLVLLLGGILAALVIIIFLLVRRS